MFQNKRILKPLLLSAIPCILAFSGAAISASATTPQSPSMQTEDRKMVMPKTKEDHMKRAEMYRQKAMDLRSEVAEHKQMLTNYKTPGSNESMPTTSGGDMKKTSAGDMKKMRMGCERYIAAAENLAKEADAMAEQSEMNSKGM